MDPGTGVGEDRITLLGGNTEFVWTCDLIAEGTTPDPNAYTNITVNLNKN